MLIERQIKHTMKKLLILALGIILLACEKPEELETNNMSISEGAEVLSSNLASNISGIFKHIEFNSEILDFVPDNSFTPKQTSLKSKIFHSEYLIIDTLLIDVENTTPKYQDSLYIKCTYASLDNEPACQIQYSSVGHHHTEKVNNNYTGNGNYNLSNFNENTITINGEFYRSCIGESKIYAKSKYNLEFIISCHQIIINKTSQKIISGDATLTAWGDIPDKGDFSFIGSLVFNGNNEAHLIINGIKYQLNTEDGTHYPIK